MVDEWRKRIIESRRGQQYQLASERTIQRMANGGSSDMRDMKNDGGGQRT